MITQKVWLASIATLIGFGALPDAAWAQQEDQATRQAAARGPQEIRMVVHGLSCPFCAYGLEKKLKKIESLDSVSIDFKTGTVVLLVRDGSEAGDERLKQLVKDAGFEAVKIERAPVKQPSQGKPEDV